MTGCLQMPLADLAHVPVYPTELRLKNMRQFEGRRDIPIVLRQHDGRWQLVDGSNRLAIARERGEANILARIEGRK